MNAVKHAPQVVRPEAPGVRELYGSIRGHLNRASSYCEVAILRGRKTVRADRRLRADEKHIRTQSAILHKSKPEIVVAFIHNRVFDTDMPFIRSKDAVGARSAQVFVARDSA